MANTWTTRTGGEVSLGNKKMLVGTASFTDGGATTITTPLKIVDSFVAVPNSAATYVLAQTFATGAISIPSAASGDLFNAVIIGT